MNLLFAYYGDDFTGSTDAMEQLMRGGVPTVLFVDPPTADQLAQFPHVRAVGVAGQSRRMTPAEMDAALPGAFAALGALGPLGPQFVHYKVCSTFDSSPAAGSVGRAIDVGAGTFENRLIPLVVGAPSLGRYCVFGNLFARSGLDSPLYRLDRHPTMSCHPVTPMDEADLSVHLARQTDRRIELIDALTLDEAPTALFTRLTQCADGSVVLFDTLTNHHLATIGAALVEWQRRGGQTLFVVGSSGVEAALTNRWRALGCVQQVKLEAPAAADRLIAVSGSCSPVTDRQIGWAVERGFVEIALDAARLIGSSGADSELEAIANRVRTEHDRGRSVIVHTSRGRQDEALAPRGPGKPTVGSLLGRVLRDVLGAGGVRRVAVAGGDTAGDVARALEIEALEMAASLVAGAPLCRAHSRVAEVDGVEFTFKGGQVGRDNFFGVALAGS